MKEYTTVRNSRSYTVKIYSETSADVFNQAVNPTTGKGWQAHKDLQNFQGERAASRAMVAWMRAARQGR